MLQGLVVGSKTVGETNNFSCCVKMTSSNKQRVNEDEASPCSYVQRILQPAISGRINLQIDVYNAKKQAR